jgi:hypothetical protein
LAPVKHDSGNVLGDRETRGPVCRLLPKH